VKQWLTNNRKFFAAILAISLLSLGLTPVITSYDNNPIGGEITIINVYSYPTVGGEWTVMFTTIGCADLIITAVNGTTWSNNNNSCDLRFLELKRGNETLECEWVNGSVVVENYSSNETGYETSEVLTLGRHTLMFRFGDDIAYAFNDASNWWNYNWNCRKLITINSSLVDGDLINFPILVNTTDSDLAAKAQDDGDDIAFVLWSDNSTKLNHEIELFNGSSGELVAWVNVTSLSSSIDTKIWMYYNNSGCSSQENPTGVWDSNFVGIWHLNETGIGTRFDSTSNNNNGTPQNYDGDEATSNGKIAGADDFDGTNDRISVDDSLSLSFTNAALTMDAWVKVDNLPSTETSIVRKEDQWAIQFHDSNTIRNLVRTSGTTGWTAANDEDYTFNTGTWYYWTFVYDGSNIVHKIDSEQVGSTHTVTGNIVDNSNPAYIAYCVYTGGHIDGIVDEVRISKVARSAAWVNTSFNTVNSSSDFLNFDSEERIVPVVSNPVPSDGATDISIPPNSFNITISHPAGKNMNITWRTNESGTWTTFNITDGGGSGVGNGTYNTTNTSWITNHSTKYWWSTNVTDGTTWTNQTYNFTTSYQPQLNSPNPANGGYSIRRPICRITVSDQDGETVTVRFYENSSIPTIWVLQQTNENVDVATPTEVEWDNYSNASEYDHDYWWKVNVTDGKGCFNEEIYKFTTSTDNPPVQSNEQPTDQTTGIPTSLTTINVTISDPDGDLMNWSIETSPDIGNNSGNNAGNSSITCSVSGLEAGTTYYWYVNVTDGVMWTNETYTFTTSYPPSITLITPSPNGTTGVGLQTTCQIWANDTEGDTLNVTWAHNISGFYINQYTNISETANTTISYQFTDFTNYSKTYYWKVYVDDGSSNVSKWFYFTTEPINTSVDPITPYEVTTSPLTINATGPSNLYNVTLWYRYSDDNSSWTIPEGWWDNSWKYRKSHEIESASGAGTNYQVKIVVENGTGSDSGDTVYIDNKARSDFGDIRFIRYSDNTTELDYWIEEINSDDNATFWVEIPDNLNTTNAKIWIYYGNSSATNNSNGTNTFIFFDDFSGDLSKWNRHTTSGVYPQIENGYLRCGGGITSSPYGHTICDSDATYTGFQNGAIDFKYRGSSSFIMELGFRGIWTSNQGYKARSDQRNNEGQSFLRPPYNGWGFFGCNQDGDEPSANTWYSGSIIVDGNDFEFYRDGELKKTCSDSTYTNAGSISCQNHYGSYSDFDDVRVRKFVDPEPAHGSWTSEEQYPTGQGCDWMIWSNISNPDPISPWNWSFDFPNGTGYYEFYSIGKKSGSQDENTPASADTICRYNPPINAPTINTYNLTNATGSKLNNLTGLIEVNKEYTFTINITDLEGWADIEYINITAWYDNGSDTATYNQTLGGNLNMFLQYENTTGTANYSMIWPDDEAQLMISNCSETIINSTTRIINFSFKPNSQTRWAPGDGAWDTTQNSTNDPYSWNFNITVTDTTNRSDYKRDEYGVYRYTSILPDSDWVDVYALPGFNDESSVVTITYSSNYDYNMTIYFEENLTHTIWDYYTISIADNVTILADADPNDDITSDINFTGIGEANAIDIFNVSGIFQKDNISQTVQVQFRVKIPFGTMSGKYTAHVATKISHD